MSVCNVFVVVGAVVVVVIVVVVLDEEFNDLRVDGELTIGCAGESCVDVGG